VASGEVIFSLGSLFYDASGGKNEMRLTYAANPVEKIEAGVEILGRLISEALEKKKSRQREPEPVPMV